MSKKTLKENVELIIFCLGLFCLTFLILGFVLKSDFSKSFDSFIFYEVLRDSLTLTAYFLAPIAAFVLFNDWREQHKIIKSDKFYDEIDIDVGGAYYLINEIFLDISQRSITDGFEVKLEDKFLLFNSKFNEIKIKIKTYKNSIGTDGKDFLDKAEKLVTLLEQVKFQTIFVKGDFIILKGNSLSEEDKKQRSIFFNENLNSMRNTLDSIHDEVEVLRDLKPII
ncbi:hypothetical protein [Acinetobacter proteolyticus]|uniref:Uncharacterized protein n=1 Tax=Acinetobacter proteolyticus TaxID=1776741 RepID=A0A2N0WEV6_9GAMM|nr:hypothetical protein [Acinetobacter proteolyticus]PKF33412.1 hypothetical protein CW311_11460 [Acinetobacter proteolyticus]